MSSILQQLEISWHGATCSVVHRETGETMQGPFSNSTNATRWIEEQGPAHLAMFNQRARAREEKEESQ